MGFDSHYNCPHLLMNFWDHVNDWLLFGQHMQIILSVSGLVWAGRETHLTSLFGNCAATNYITTRHMRGSTFTNLISTMQIKVHVCPLQRCQSHLCLITSEDLH
jgi:tRNA(His) 5'-end guanylyltransferase